jgi:hypothetical protein
VFSDRLKCAFYVDFWRGLRGFNTDLTQFLQYYYQFSVFFRVNPCQKGMMIGTIPTPLHVNGGAIHRTLGSHLCLLAASEVVITALQECIFDCET